MKEQQVRQAFHDLAEHAVPENHDLWPGLRARVQARAESARERSTERAPSRPPWIFGGRQLQALGAMALVLITLVPYLNWANREQVRVFQGSYVTNFDDPRRVVGFADAVFLGRVMEEVGTDGVNGIPSTQFKVDVLQTIKSVQRRDPRDQAASLPNAPAVLPDTVIVHQAGGRTQNLAGKRMVVLMDNDPLLVPGRTYLLAARYNPDKAGYTVMGPYGTLDADDAQARAALVEQFTAAYREQIPYDPSGS